MEPSHNEVQLRQAAEHYIEQLRNGDFDSAFHGLIDLDPAIVQPLIEGYRAETDLRIRKGLLRIIWEFRSPLGLPLLSEALRIRERALWRTALDGLNSLASPEAIQALESALRDETNNPNRDPDYDEWVREALEQTREAHTARLAKPEDSR